MAARVDTDEDDVIAEINVIPFVDIVLVLLIIFMLTSTVIMRAALQVELPKAASADSAVATTLNLVLEADGGLWLDGEAVSRAAAADRARATARDNPDAQAVISADRGVDYGRVIELIDLVKGNGIQTFALNVERGTATP